MKIDYQAGTFIALITFDERKIVEGAGWSWDGDMKRWITRDPALAEQYAPLSTDAAFSAIVTWREGLEHELRASYATNSTMLIPAPPGLEYDGFQKAGIEYASKRKDVLIADPPGLGKTIQAIGMSNLFSNIKKILIVPPAHLKLNWMREWQKWCVKGLTVGICESVQKRERVLDDAGKPAKKENGTARYRTWTEYPWPATDVVIINYDMLPEFYEHIQQVAWDMLVCDEAQYLVSEKTMRARHVFGGGKQKVFRKGQKPTWRPALSGISARRRLFLSGTPILSRPIDLWTICKACDPTGLGSNWMTFVQEYCDAHVLDADKPSERLDTSGASNLDELQRQLRLKFMVRRPKSILNLPIKRRQLIPLPAEGLAKLIASEMTAMDRVKAALSAFEHMGEGDVGETAEEVPWTTLSDALERRFAGHQDKDYRECMIYLSTPEQVAFEELSTARRSLATAKIPMVKEHLDGMLETGVKVIVFVVHTEMAETLHKHYPDAAFVTGKTPSSKRQAQVDRFQDDDGCRLFIGNIVAAGTGFTMTAATVVVFAELDWVPAKIEQAEDRAHRRGQKSQVLVQHLAVEGSVDARLIEVLLEKQAVIHDALDDDALPERVAMAELLASEVRDDHTFRLLSVT